MNESPSNMARISFGRSFSDGRVLAYGSCAPLFCGAVPKALAWEAPKALGCAVDPNALGCAVDPNVLGCAVDPNALGCAVDPNALDWVVPNVLGGADPNALGFAAAPNALG